MAVETGHPQPIALGEPIARVHAEARRQRSEGKQKQQRSEGNQSVVHRSMLRRTPLGRKWQKSQ
jgi:hypothetical protein